MGRFSVFSSFLELGISHRKTASWLFLPHHEDVSVNTGHNAPREQDSCLYRVVSFFAPYSLKVVPDLDANRVFRHGCVSRLQGQSKKSAIGDGVH